MPASRAKGVHHESHGCCKIRSISLPGRVQTLPLLPVLAVRGTALLDGAEAAERGAVTPGARPEALRSVRERLPGLREEQVLRRCLQEEGDIEAATQEALTRERPNLLTRGRRL